MKKTGPAFVLPLVLSGLITGLLGGWLRLGFEGFYAPIPTAHHGILMVGGFFGTLISLERSVIMKKRVWLMVPMLSGLSIPFFLGGLHGVGAVFLGVSSVGLVSMMYLQTLKTPHIYAYLIAFGAASWMLGNFVYVYTGFVALSASWWMAFLFFTIIGERLELSRFLPIPSRIYYLFYLILACYGLGLLLPFHQGGGTILGISAVGAGLWLLRFDMARVGVKKTGQFRYIGTSLLVGFIWLVLHGLVLLFLSNHPYHYDLYLHTFFLGFAFSMIWAHAPIIFPAVFKVRVDLFHPFLWWGWIVFQLSLLGRIYSAWAEWSYWRYIFGTINGISILGVFLSMGFIFYFRKQGGEPEKRAEIMQRAKKSAP